MSEIAIRAEGLSKRYRLGERERYLALRDVLTRAMRSPLSLLRGKPKETFWALKDVNLEVRHGEVLGFIGRNGAGKTTLLKILSRITRPTTGWADIYGRVGSLLEVGTGFHPELTGRENIYLSGAILGMPKTEINRKFEEIVAFSELERFLDMQVKHYSSGMYVRLAFAVAAHLEPEILLVDEVLAVGDIKFQKKCLGKIGEVARQGRTVILVSHQLNQIRRLCQRVIWMDEGKTKLDASTHEVLAAYELEMLSTERVATRQRSSPPSRSRFVRWEISETDEGHSHVLSTLGPVIINFEVELARPVRLGVHGAALLNVERQVMWAHAEQGVNLDPGVHVLSHTFPTIPLSPGVYQWQVSLWDGSEVLDLWDCVPRMTIATEVHQHYLDQWNGILNLPTKFGHRRVKEASVESTPRV